MPRFFILLGLIAVAFLVLLAVPGSNEQPPASKEDYEPSGFFAWIGGGAASRPGYKLLDRPFTVLLNQPRAIPVPAPKKAGETRLAKLALVSTGAAIIRYGGKTLCLVPAGAANPPGCRGKPRSTGSIPLEPAAGTMSVEAVGASVQIESR